MKGKPVTTYHVASPDPSKERVVPYYTYASEKLKSVFGTEIHRNTLVNYAQRGYPIQRGGPYVEMPTYTRLKRVYTTAEAMSRFLKRVVEAEEQEGIRDMGMHLGSLDGEAPKPAKKKSKGKKSRSRSN